MIERLKKGDQRLKRELRYEPIPHEPFSAYVESSSVVVPEGQDWKECGHVVDLLSNPCVVNGRHIFNGSCTCERFNYYLFKRVGDGKIHRCEHIKTLHRPAGDALLMRWYIEHRTLVDHKRDERIAAMKKQ